MARVRFTDVPASPTEFQDLTSSTRDEFQQLVPPCEAVFQAHLAQFIVTCNASKLAEALRISSLFSSQSRAKKRASSRPTRSYLHPSQPTTNAAPRQPPFFPLLERQQSR
jgi:hypothetical protein